MFIRFVHRPLSRYVNALAAAGLRDPAHGRAGAAAGFLARAAEYEEAATIPRLAVPAGEKDTVPAGTTWSSDIQRVGTIEA